MKSVMIIMACIICALHGHAQSSYSGIVAERDGRSKEFRNGRNLKVKFQNGVIISKIKGTLVAVNDTAITLRSNDRIIAFDAIQGITQVSGVRRLTGSILVLGSCIGLIVTGSGISDLHERKGEWFAGAGIVVGVGLIAAVAIPHVLVLISERKARTSYGYTFKPLPRAEAK